ncbi:Conserved_hypothetical protein [Hexamita inflata]|uniref:Uncharacterized protein n=1 Tax=Hexamita inflata TaxID=28002 RepID=A0AA86PMD0_9EUKA|nr:Conserved hypothetical protein [Hexamita inflata]
MPVSKLEYNHTLQVIKKQMCSQLGFQENQIDYLQISALLENNIFDWDIVSQQLSVSKHYVKRWIRETYQRQNSIKMSNNDHNLLQTITQHLMNKGVDLGSKAVQIYIKNQLSQQYHWQVFYQHFSNAKRFAKKQMITNDQFLKSQIKQLLTYIEK